MQNLKLYSIIKDLIQEELSDIHILEDRPIFIRDASGQIKEKDIVVDSEELWWFIHHILPPWKIDEFMGGEEMDTSFTVENVRFRVNLFQDHDWNRIALRKISAQPPSMESIGFWEDIKEFLKKDKWLILVTWPTGSWKSTSLASMLDFINQEKTSHIITLEDPIEYVFENKTSLITQRSIWKNTRTWENALKYALRQDPDVIMLWEMRDLETIKSALTLVETWHMVLSTLHTVNAVQTISRIIDIFPPYQQEQIAVQLSMSLQMVVSQKLLPTVDMTSRVAAREILVNTTAVANNIRERRLPQISSVMETGQRYWMQTMDYSLAKLVAEWKISTDSVAGKISNMENFKTLLSALRDGKSKFKPID